VSVSKVIRVFAVIPARRTFTSTTLLASACLVTVVHMAPSTSSATVLGIVNAEWVLPALHVTDAKMDIMALVRMAACPAIAIIGLPVVMLSQGLA
jgi:hypothetical protein